ncbi:hypothetical protein [Micromonospora sp. NPDC050695]|uniref:hypothetical protein n=1 Tax=Micromonospora sp. NPDC050695 TaxID=3154938 RepID=UPI0033EA7DC2
MTDTTTPAQQLAALVGDDNARKAIQAGWDAIRHPETGRLLPTGFEQDYLAMILLAAIPALNAWTVPKIQHDESRLVGPHVRGRWVHRSEGQSDPDNTRVYAAQLLAAADLAEVQAAIHRVHYPIGDPATEGNVWCACDKLWPCETVLATSAAVREFPS